MAWRGWARARGTAIGVVLGLLIAGCTAPSPGGPAGSPSVAASASMGPRAAVTLSGDKAASGQRLPKTVDGWRLARTRQAGGAASGFYTDAAASGELVVTLTPVALTDEALAVALPDRRQVGAATCGTLAGAGGPACYLPLRGGNVRVTGPLPLEALAALTEHVYATFS